MYYELYIDVLFLENFMMDSLLLLSLKQLEKHVVTYARVFTAALIGAGAGCTVVVLNTTVLLKYIISYIVIPFVMVSVGLKIKDVSLILRSTIILYIIAILYAGIMNLLRPYIRYASLFYGTAVVAYLAVNGIGKLIVELKCQQRNVYNVTIITSKGTFQLRALEDTGNRLTDPVSKKSVSIIDQKTAEIILGVHEDIHDPIRVNQEILVTEGIRYITYRTIAGESLMPIIRVKKMIVHQKYAQEIIDPLIGICKEPVSERQLYQMILNSDILGGTKNVNKNSVATTV